MTLRRGDEFCLGVGIPAVTSVHFIVRFRKTVSGQTRGIIKRGIALLFDHRLGTVNLGNGEDKNGEDKNGETKSVKEEI